MPDEAELLTKFRAIESEQSEGLNAKEMGAFWKELTDEERKVYKDKAAAMEVAEA